MSAAAGPPDIPILEDVVDIAATAADALWLVGFLAEFGDELAYLWDR